MSLRVVTVPNLLTVLRMVLIPVFVSLLYYQKLGLALLVFVSAGITDGLDGLLARRFNQKSQFGTILDPIADKLLLVTAFIVLSLPSIVPQPYPRHLPVPFWVTAAVISRDIFIVVGAVTINIVTGFRRFRPSWLGKMNTVVQILTLVFILTALLIPSISGYLPTAYTTVVAFAVLSGLHYVYLSTRIINEERPSVE